MKAILIACFLFPFVCLGQVAYLIYFGIIGGWNMSRIAIENLTKEAK